MKILLSAYACEPNKGSEPAVGWQWAIETSRLGHNVWVLTRENNRANIEEEIKKLPLIKKLNFIYYDLPRWAQKWKKGKCGIYFYYLIWQLKAYLLAKKVHETEKFDRVHHVTFANVRQPSFMGNLGIPFDFGPVGGGERAPWRLRLGYGLRGFFTDALRDLANYLIRIDPILRQTLKKAERIYTTSEQTLSLLPIKYQKKAVVKLAIGFNPNETSSFLQQHCEYQVGMNRFRILYVGRLLYWKGMHLGIPAFARLLENFPYAQMTIVGNGPDEIRCRTIAKKLGVFDQINWVPWLNQKKLSLLYANHDAFLFPSLHDSGGMVLLEAMASGLPIICLDLGGPGVVVDNTFGRVISTARKSESQVLSDLGSAMFQFAQNPHLRRELGLKAKQKVKEYSWAKSVAQVYAECNSSV